MTLARTTSLLLCALTSSALADLETPDPVHITLDASYFTMVPASDGGVIALGEFKDESNDTDIGLSRIAPDMTASWTVTFAGSNDESDRLLDVAARPDGGVTVLGFIEDVDDAGFLDRKMLVANVSDAGEVIWTREFPSTGLLGGWTSAHKTRLATSSNGRTCIVDNILYESIDLHSLDADGNLEWTQTFNLLEMGTEMSLEVTMNDAGEILVGGLWNDAVTSGQFVAAFSSEGEHQWTHMFDAGDGSLGEAFFIRTDAEGNWIVCGNLMDVNHDGYTYVARITPGGTILWQNQYEVPGEDSLTLRDCDVADDGAVVLTASRYSPDANAAIVALKYESNGQLAWAADAIAPVGDYGHSVRGVACQADGRIQLAGLYWITNGSSSDSVQLTITMNAEGIVTDTTEWNPSVTADINLDVVIDVNDDVYVCGKANTTGTNFQDDGTVMKINSCPADIDGNGAVTVTDLLALLAAYGSSNQEADLDDDGIVGVSDLLMLLENWNGCNG